MADKVALTNILNERKIVLVAVKLRRYHDLGDAPRKSGEATPMERFLAILIISDPICVKLEVYLICMKLKICLIIQSKRQKKDSG